jgi:UDP-N-acetylmuramoyl-tripeptide--D-alanyl-D-alanine ligase
MNLKIKDIVKATKGKLIKGDPELVIKDISSDSRVVKKGGLFIALSGKFFKAFPDSRFDGHHFLGSALRKGAIGAIVSKNIKEDFKVIIKVKDTLGAYHDLAGFWRSKFNIPVVAITGSNGKTTTKDMVTSILKEKFKVLSSQESYNNQVGVPITILELEPSHEVLVLELGTNMPGEMKILNSIAKPTIGAITNIGPTHLERFKTVGGVKREKENIFKGVEVKIRGKKSLKPMEQNRDVAIRIGKALGLSKSMIEKGLKKFKLPKMRMEKIKRNGALIINDAYNANPASMRYALNELIKYKGRKIAVLGDMLELGKNSDQFHTDLGKDMPKSIDILITVGKKAKLMGGDYSYKTTKGAKAKLKGLIESGDTVLLKASRGMKLEKVI